MEFRPAFRGTSRVVLLAGALACGGGSSSVSTTSQPTRQPTTQPTTQPTAIAGDVERTAFASSLGVDLGAMTKRASGLYVQDLETGTGAVAVRGKSAVVRYAGWLPNGKQFDSGEVTVTLGTNKVIQAWEEGLLGMRVGGRRRLVTPPNLAYGPRGAGDDIPPNAVLVFEMQVMSIL
jgi:FKBP-type peptidyl-prolyl cis-trans isomerase FkpA